MSQSKDIMNKKAVALSYDEDHNAAPIIVASGSGYMAQKIIETARENGIPVYEDNSLATMLTQLDLGSEIPEALYQAIVDIYVYFLNFSTKHKNAELKTPKEETQPSEKSDGEDMSSENTAAEKAEPQNDGTTPAPPTQTAPTEG